MNNFRHHLKVKFKKKYMDGILWKGWDSKGTHLKDSINAKKNKHILALTTNIIMYKYAIVHPKLTKAVIKAL